MQLDAAGLHSYETLHASVLLIIIGSKSPLFLLHEYVKGIYFMCLTLHVAYGRDERLLCCQWVVLRAQLAD